MSDIKKKLGNHLRVTFQNKKEPQISVEQEDVFADDQDKKEYTGINNSQSVINASESNFMENLMVKQPKQRSMTKIEVAMQEIQEQKKISNDVAQIENGEKIQKLVMANDIEMVDKAFVLLYEDMYTYRRNYFKKWLCFAFGLILAVILIFPTQLAVTKLSYALYDRKGLNYVANLKFEDRRFDDIYADELLVVAYAYN